MIGIPYLKGMNFHLAQINIGRMIAPPDHPLIADFMAQIDEINALAEQSPGFVWRLKEESGNATNIQVFDDPLLLVNMSVWESPEALKNYVYRSDHMRVFRDRAKWFHKMDKPHLAMWWIPVGEIPDAWEGKRRVEHLQEHGESELAFSFRKIPSPPAVWQL